MVHMHKRFNVYCDESCHLEHDRQSAMVLGAIWCPQAKARQIAEHIRGIKVLHGLGPHCEIKWTKVSPSKVRMYLGLINYFFQEEDLHFRALIIPDKSLLRHDKFEQDHDKWYYKMYFDMLKVLLLPHARYKIFLDIKDTRGAAKVRDLREVLCNNVYDYDREIIQVLQQARSHEIEQLQLADLLIGCVSYINRGLSSSAAKNMVADRFKQMSGYQLTRSTLLSERKVNLFRWHAQQTGE